MTVEDETSGRKLLMVIVNEQSYEIAGSTEDDVV
jgi:hypothetical protein